MAPWRSCMTRTAARSTPWPCGSSGTRATLKRSCRKCSRRPGGRRSRYDPARATVVGWLLMITRARALDALRAREARPDAQRPVALPDLPAGGQGQEAVMLSNESVAMVRDALARAGRALSRSAGTGLLRRSFAVRDRRPSRPAARHGQDAHANGALEIARRTVHRGAAMSANHDDFAALAHGYVLGTLTEEEARTFASHLRDV